MRALSRTPIAAALRFATTRSQSGALRYRNSFLERGSPAQGHTAPLSLSISACVNFRAAERCFSQLSGRYNGGGIGGDQLERLELRKARPQNSNRGKDEVDGGSEPKQKLVNAMTKG